MFSKSRGVKTGCLHSSRTGIIAFIRAAFNAGIRDMRGVRDLPAKEEGLPAKYAKGREKRKNILPANNANKRE